MTRKEYEEFFHSYNHDQFSGGAFIIVATQYIYQLEHRIAELESPRTCEGCMYAQVRYYDSGTVWFKDVASSRCNVCRRNHEDYYEPKDKE